MKRVNNLIIPALIFVAVLVSHFISPVRHIGDSMWFVPTAMSIIKEGNIELSEYQYILDNDKRVHGLTYPGNSVYSRYPIGTSITAMPFVFIFDKVSDGFYESVKRKISGNSEVFIASFMIALTSVFMFLVFHSLLDNMKYALLMTFIFAFCTSAWSTASRALWQHGPSMLMLSVALYLIVLARKKPSLIQFIGLPLAFSYVIRPSNSVSLVLLTAFVLIQYRKWFLRCVLWTMVIMVPFIIHNMSLYDSLLPPYYMLVRDFSSPYLRTALLGNMISPARGIFVFSPIFLFCFYGVFLKIKNRQFEKLDFLVISIVLLHWLGISMFPNWYGGRSFGPRYFSDMIPYFMYLLVPVAWYIIKAANVKKAAMITILSCFIAVSFFIHYRGATSIDTFIEWYAKPIPVTAKTERLWDWSDLQFMRGFNK